MVANGAESVGVEVVEGVALEAVGHNVQTRAAPEIVGRVESKAVRDAVSGDNVAVGIEACVELAADVGREQDIAGLEMDARSVFVALGAVVAAVGPETAGRPAVEVDLDAEREQDVINRS